MREKKKGERGLYQRGDTWGISCYVEKVEGFQAYLAALPKRGGDKREISTSTTTCGFSTRFYNRLSSGTGSRRIQPIRTG
jgi:hypothetical protein